MDYNILSFVGFNLHLVYAWTFLQDRESFAKKLGDAEDWLYDEGEGQIKSVYQGKLESLKVRRPVVFVLVKKLFSDMYSQI